MKLSLSKLPVRKLFYALLFILFLFSLFSEYNKLLVLHENMWSKEDHGLHTILATIKVSRVFQATAFMLIPVLGIFLKNKVGWVLVSSFFYFLGINLLVQLDQSDTLNIELVLFAVIFSIIIGVIILLMNKSSNINKFHKTIQANRSLLNMVAAIIGFGLSITLIILKA